MCFSPTASFGAGIVLTIIGIATIKKTRHPSQILFASVPLIFGIQQIAEGILWLSLPNPDLPLTQKTFTYIFLFFAQVVWPIWIPIAILFLEKKETRKRIQKIIVLAGLMVGIYLAVCLILFKVEAKIDGKHILYIQNYPFYFKNFVIVFYATATIAPTFVSHVKKMWLLGATIAVSYVISSIFYDHYVLSVWCFFSSIISLSIYSIMADLYRENKRIIR